MEEHSRVVLLEDIPERNLCKGLVGIVVHVYSSSYCEVEFMNLEGKTFACETLPSSSLLALRYMDSVNN